MRNIIDKYSRKPFRYGADCCQFVGECVEELTGSNPMARFEYATKREAYAIIDGYGSLEKAITATLGEPCDEYGDGDVCVFRQSNGTEVAGVMYNERIIARTPTGVMDYPPSWARQFWRVSCRR